MPDSPDIDIAATADAQRRVSMGRTRIRLYACMDSHDAPGQSGPANRAIGGFRWRSHTRIRLDAAFPVLLPAPRLTHGDAVRKREGEELWQPDMSSSHRWT